MADFAVSILGGDPVVIRLTGEIDLAALTPVADAVETALAGGPRGVWFDLDGVSFIDSSGLRALVTAKRQVDDTAGEFAVVAASRAVTRIFELTGLATVFNLSPTPSRGAAGGDRQPGGW